MELLLRKIELLPASGNASQGSGEAIAESSVEFGVARWIGKERIVERAASIKNEATFPAGIR
jgi:hypothetical protein